MSGGKHTPGPWGWFGSTRTSMYLATVHGGRRYVMGFKRKGMNGAEPVFRDNDRMVPASSLAIYEVNREATDAKDPSVYRHDIVGFRSADARLIAAAPEMFEALAQAAVWFGDYAKGHLVKGDTDKAERNQARADACLAAIAKAEGRS